MNVTINGQALSLPIRPRDKRVIKLGSMRPTAEAIMRDLTLGGGPTGWFCRYYGSGWRSRISDLRQALEQSSRGRVTILTERIPGSAQCIYSIAEVRR